jgi:hypothetical protein
MFPGGTHSSSIRPDLSPVSRTPLLALLVLSVTAPPLAAQVNTERLRLADDTAGLSGDARGDLTVRTGSVSLVLLGLGGRIDVATGRTLTFLVGSGNVGWQDGRRFSNEGLAHLRHSRAIGPSLRAEGFTQLDYNKSRKLDFRSLLGLGPRFELVRNPAFHLAVGTAWMLEHERYDLPDSASHPQEVTTQRWSNYVSARLDPSNRLGIVLTTYAQPRFDDFGDIRILADARLALTLTGPVALTNSFNARYDSRPPDGVTDLDTTLRTGIAVEW